VTQFERLLASAEAAVDRVNAEPFGFQPMRENVNGRAGADPARPPRRVQAIFTDLGFRLEDGARGGGGNRPMLERSSSGPVISVRESELPEGVRRLDRLTRERTGAVYEVKGVDPDGLGRTMLRVVEVGG
jgi:hypothetical protein